MNMSTFCEIKYMNRLFFFSKAGFMIGVGFKILTPTPIPTLPQVPPYPLLAYPLPSVTLTFAHIDGLKISTDKSTLFRKLEVRIITDAPRNNDVFYCRWNVPVQSHVDLPSFFGGQANVTLSRLVRCANHVDFSCDTFKYPSINDITRDHGFV